MYYVDSLHYESMKPVDFITYIIQFMFQIEVHQKFCGAMEYKLI